MVQAHRIQPDLVGAGPRHHAGDLRDLAHEGLVDLQVERRRLLQADRRQLLDADDDVAFVHFGEKGLPHLGVDAGRRHEKQRRRYKDNALLLQGPCEHRLVDLEQLAWQPGILVCHLLQKEGGQHRDHRERQHQ